MPTRTDESPPRQQDRALEVSRDTRDELCKFESDGPQESGHPDAGVSEADDPDINTHGSER